MALEPLESEKTLKHPVQTSCTGLLTWLSVYLFKVVKCQSIFLSFSAERKLNTCPASALANRLLAMTRLECWFLLSFFCSCLALCKGETTLDKSLVYRERQVCTSLVHAYGSGRTCWIPPLCLDIWWRWRMAIMWPSVSGWSLKNSKKSYLDYKKHTEAITGGICWENTK